MKRRAEERVGGGRGKRRAEERAGEGQTSASLLRGSVCHQFSVVASQRKPFAAPSSRRPQDDAHEENPLHPLCNNRGKTSFMTSQRCSKIFKGWITV